MWLHCLTIIDCLFRTMVISPISMSDRVNKFGIYRDLSNSVLEVGWESWIVDDLKGVPLTYQLDNQLTHSRIKIAPTFPLKNQDFTHLPTSLKNQDSTHLPTQEPRFHPPTHSCNSGLLTKVSCRMSINEPLFLLFVFFRYANSMTKLAHLAACFLINCPPPFFSGS